VSPSLRKLATTLALVGALAVGGRLFGLFGTGPVPLEIHYFLGPAPQIASLEVVSTRAGSSEPAARFETQLIGPDVVHRTRLPGGDVRLDVTLVSPGGARHTVTRTITAERDATIRIDLSRDVLGEGG